jgi:uncharacterized membrane protein
MHALYILSVSLHILAALLWLGGMLFLAVVAAPVLRGLEPAALRARLFQALGVRFRLVGWIAIGVLVITGLVSLHYRNVLRPDVLGDPAFWGSGFGRALGWKLAAVTAMIALSAVHDFALGPAASRADPASAEAQRYRRWSTWIARLNALVGLALVHVAVRLARGG